jgi:hypothetical protein
LNEDWVRRQTLLESKWKKSDTFRRRKTNHPFIDKETYLPRPEFEKKGLK